MKIKASLKRSIMFIAFVSTAWLFRSCIDTILFDKNLDSTCISPLGTRTILVRYDYVSRPSVFINGERLFEYQGSGFAETVFWNVVWASEQQIILTYDDSNDQYDQKYYINVP